ncbi:hypothetical protein HKX48_005049 [Thoreauomyces humboldtii]|nr:hypothetical protein HKX48_005049 [Thoreauomyces humboldtii]
MIHPRLIKTLLVLAAIFLQYVDACGCYGNNTCTARGIECQRGTLRYMNPNDLCICDCCAACNDCPALLKGCGGKPSSALKFSPSLHTLRVGKPIKPRTLISTAKIPESLGLWGELCLNGTLPKGLSFTYNETAATFTLHGTPTVRGKHTVDLIAHGGGGVIYRLEVHLAVAK